MQKHLNISWNKESVWMSISEIGWRCTIEEKASNGNRWPLLLPMRITAWFWLHTDIISSYLRLLIIQDAGCFRPRFISNKWCKGQQDPADKHFAQQMDIRWLVKSQNILCSLAKMPKLEFSEKSRCGKLTRQKLYILTVFNIISFTSKFCHVFKIFIDVGRGKYVNAN